MEVFIIRHTRVDVSSGVCYGQSDLPLAGSFARELQEYKDSLPGDFDAVYSSPLSRCRNLTIALGFESIYVPEPKLMEMYFGDWEGKEWDKIDQIELNLWMQDFTVIRPPDGENLQELYNRCVNFLEELSEKNHNKVLLVTHSGFIRCIWAYILNINLTNIFKFPVGFGETLVVKLDTDQEKCCIIAKK